MTNRGHLNQVQQTYAKLIHAIIENEGVECEQLPEFFFPQRDSMNQIHLEIRVAKDVCARCPIVAECLEYAIVGEEAYGIWGGTTPEERRSLKATSKRAF